MKKWKKLLNWKCLIFSLLMTTLALILSLTSSFNEIDNLIKDKIFQHETQSDSEIAIVMLDSKTLESLGAYDAKIYRDAFTTFLNDMDSANIHPSVIGFDMIFGENKSYDDTNFAASISKHNVVLGIDSYNRNQAPYGLSSKLYDASKQIGCVDTDSESGNTIRHIMLKGNNYDSLAYSVYSSYCKEKSITPTNYNKNEFYYFDYYAGQDEVVNRNSSGEIISSTSLSKYTSYSLVDFLTGEKDYKRLKNKIVLIGAYASGLDTGLSDDKYNTALGEMYGIEIQANIIQALKNDAIYTEVPKALTVSFNLVIVFVLSYFMSLFTFWIAGIIYVASFGIEVGMMFILHAGKTYYFVSIPVILLFIGFVLIIAYHYYSEYKRKKEVLGTFKRYISPDVAESLLDKESNAFALGGSKRNVACLFVDIRGFTKMSEELPPEVIVDVLNGYLDMATRQVFRYGGMVDKFIGDCVMAVFNAPVDLDDYIFKAVSAAYAIVKEGKPICDMVMEKYGKKLEFGVGVHYGDAVIGNIGSKTRMDYTAIGDTVNTASRIEASAGGNQVLISSDTYLAVKDRVSVVDAGDRMFKNKKEPIKCFEVTKIKDYVPEALDKR